MGPCPARYLKVREMGGAPRNLAPKNHLLVWIVKTSACQCTDGHLTCRAFSEGQQIIVECRPPSGALPLSPIRCPPGAIRSPGGEGPRVAGDVTTARRGRNRSHRCNWVTGEGPEGTASCRARTENPPKVQLGARRLAVSPGPHDLSRELCPLEPRG